MIGINTLTQRPLIEPQAIMEGTWANKPTYPYKIIYRAIAFIAFYCIIAPDSLIVMVGHS